MKRRKIEDYKSFVKFFNNITDFYVKHGLAKQEMFIGISDYECTALENALNLKFDPALKAYLNVFGGGIYVPGFEHISLWTKKSIARAYQAIENKKKFDKDVIKLILNVTKLDSCVKEELEEPLRSVILLAHSEVGGAYDFIEGTEINPYVYTYYPYGDDFLFLGMRLTEFVRGIFSYRVLTYCAEKKWDESDKVVNSLLKLDWVQFYQLALKDNFYDKPDSYHRGNFNLKTAEGLTDDNMDFNKGEENYVNYLLVNNLM